ncbi:MAG: HAD-IC family P-type ATPase, partial [Clostridia bacterium]|nr:HAD-IC family P-type ATPase [Clostridia bacterium]
MIWHTLSAEDALKKLASDKSNGLTSDEAEERLNKDGKNEITDSKKESIVKKFLEQFNDYMIIILLIAAAISFVIALYERNNDFIEPIVIISIVFLNALIGTIQEEKAEKSLLALKKMTRPTACVIRNGLPSTVNASDIVCGDIIKLKAGDFVPADARIISCNNLCTDESSLTGESYSILKDANKILKADTPISDMKNMVWSSTAITGGNCTAVVTNTGMDTQVGKIAKAIIESKTPPTPLQVKLESTGKILGTIALIICALVFATGIFKNIPPIEMFMTSVSLAVAAIPEGLPAIVTVMLAIGVQKMAYKNAIVRKLPTVETLGSASVICSDKTGTITQNKMTVTNVFGNENEVISKACLCSNNTDSTERAIIEYANVNHIDIPEYKRVKEIPFNSSTKYMMTVHKYENKYISVVKGAFDILIDKFALSESEHKIHIAKMTEMTNNGLRVISVGYFISSGIPSG